MTLGTSRATAGSALRMAAALAANGREVVVRPRIKRRIAYSGLAVLAVGLAGCHGFTLGSGRVGVAPDESIQNLTPEKTQDASSQPPAAEIHTPAELAAQRQRLQPRDRYAPAPPADNLHEVQRGETLFGLARQYYGDQRQWRRIYQANRKRIPDPQRIKAGMKLIIP